MILKKLLLKIILLTCIGCQSFRILPNLDSIKTLKQGEKNIQKAINNWQHKDIYNDTIPGISLDKAYEKIIRQKKGNQIIVAVMDTGIDIIHKDLKDQVWINNDEIADNGIDDDANGYIDDIHGWNFLGNKEGGIVVYENLEFIKIIKKYKPYFEHKNEDQISIKDQGKYDLYKNALKEYEKSQAVLKDDRDFITSFIDKQNKAKDALKIFLGTDEYTYEEISRIDPKEDEELKKHIANRRYALYYKMDDDWIDDFKQDIEISEKYKLNLEYDGRRFIGDDIGNLEDINYGNNKISGDLEIESHGTSVAGLIAASRNNHIGIEGIINNTKIMPLRIVPKGDEYDKDVANGIRYAVDNGAKVINMSFGKEFSLHREYVTEAIKYAAKNDVLLVCAAGNDGFSIDKNNYYPNDAINSVEVSNNFIKVGASTPYLDARLIAGFSNYGNVNVDIFAPGDDIYTTAPNNKYKSDGGTSFAAPIVSGVAALIRSYYPSLSAAAVKDILMQSGTAYHINVEIEQEDGTKKLVPFSELSKSGRIVNAYNALLLAEKVANTKQ